MKPGTYRIVNLASGTAITEIGPGEVASRPVNHDSKDQQWFAQHSGNGYRFKGLTSGGYLAIASTDDHNCELYSSGYPTSWMLIPNPEHRGYNTYGILMGDTDRILDLADGPKRADQTKASLSNFSTIAANNYDEIGEGFELSQQRKVEGSLEVSQLKEEVVRLTSQVERLNLLLAEARDLPRPGNNMT